MISPAVVFGALEKVNTTLKHPLPPNGQWQVAGLTYNLDTITPRGDWFVTLNLVPKGSVSVPPL